MPPIELGPLSPLTPRSPAPAAARKTPGPVANDTARAHASPNSAVVRSAELDPGQPPVDSGRVAEIRRAIERGSYPVIPMRVTDAMIAAGMLLRSVK